jgi:hypothetical protein
VSEKDKELEERARAIVREIELLLTNLTDLLKPYIDPVDEWDLERDAFEIVEKLSSWVEAVLEKRARG